MNVEELKQLLHEQNESVLSTNIPEVIAWCPLSEIEPYKDKEKDGTSRLE